MTELILTIFIMGFLFLIMTLNRFVHQKGRHAKMEQKNQSFLKYKPKKNTGKQ
jgi:hypothetical protein